MFRSATCLVLCVLIALSVVLASPHDAIIKARKQLARRERGLSLLGPSVRAWVEQLDPKDVFFDDAADEEDDVTRRAAAAPRRGDGSVVNCIESRQAVTYDDGPWEHHLALAERWNAQGHKITYFVNGNNWACSYDKPWVSYMRKSVAAGNQLAYHSWSHPHLSSASHEQLDHQIELMQNLTLKTIGVTAKYFRFPYGEQRADQIAHLKKRWDIDTIYWSEDVEDSDGGTAGQAIALYDSLDTSRPHLVLNHETGAPAYTTVAPRAIEALNKKGKKSRTVHVCMGAAGSPYHVQISPQPRDGSWTCNGKPAPGQAW